MITMTTITQKALTINKKHLRTRKNNVLGALRIISSDNE